MTQTLRRERIQKFREITEKSPFVMPLYSHLVNSYRQKSKEEINSIVNNIITEFCETLADASISRSEIAGEYKTDADKEEEARKFNAPVFRGDWRDYPEHLHKIAECLRDVWMFVLPEKPQKANRKKSKYAFFIMSMESIRESCGEFGVKALEETHKKWRAGFKNGIAPYTVATPQSLVNMVASTAREMRESGISEQPTRPEHKKIIHEEAHYVPRPEGIKRPKIG